MSHPPTPFEVAASLVPMLDELKLDYMLLGGLAVVTWGIPRATVDAVALSAREDAILRLLAALDEAGHLVDETYRRGWRDKVGGMPLVKFKWRAELHFTTVDLFPIDTPFQQSAFSRRVLVPVGSRRLWMVSAADLVVFKLLAWRDKDRADLHNILTVQGVPEPAYLAEWVGRLGLEVRFAPFRVEHGGQDG